MSEQSISVIWFIVGAILSVALPFLREYVDSGSKFQLRKLIGQILALAATVAGQVLGIYDQLQGATPVIAFAAGMGISFAGRQAQKTFDAIRVARNGG